MHPGSLVPLLGTLLLAGVSGCVPRPESASIALSCTGTAATDDTVVEDLCNALEMELRAREPSRAFHRASPGAAKIGATRHLILEVVRTDPALWEARLLLEVAGPEDGAVLEAGPFVRIASMDAPFGPGAYRRFARGILKVGEPSF